ncbi:MAG TPA: C40 family peptidase [Gaiellaceae bacterium]|jgi:cell wall-associated NlpC family hydrolase|nr:C40 family peptidase [Gaiellaceae bacterium]
MTAQLRLILLVLVLAYSVAFGAAGSFGAPGKRGPASHRLKQGPRPNRRRAAAATARSTDDSVGDRAVRFARKLLGTPYRWGGDSPSTGFDCSGFVRFVYAHFGVELPHSSYGDFDLGKRVGRGALKPGDLVFFDGVGHVGMYIGNDRFIHAPHSGTDVQVTSLSESWYQASYDGARRLFRPARRLATHVRATAGRVSVKRRDPWLAAYFDGTTSLRALAETRSER